MVVIGSSDKCLPFILESRMPLPDPASRTLPSARAHLPERVWTCARSSIPGLRSLALLAAAAGSLGACSQPDVFAPACPQLALLRDGADLTRFAGPGRDITDLVLDAHLAAVPATCHWADKAHTKVEAKLQVAISLGRGPAMNGRTVDVPYFLAASEGANILDKQIFTARAEFPTNTDRVGVTTPEVSMLFPVTPEKSAAAYKITVSFQLTPEELAYNRGRGTP
jgi:hypothetical protein